MNPKTTTSLFGTWRPRDGEPLPSRRHPRIPCLPEHLPSRNCYGYRRRGRRRAVPDHDAAAPPWSARGAAGGVGAACGGQPPERVPRATAGMSLVPIRMEVWVGWRMDWTNPPHVLIDRVYQQNLSVGHGWLRPLIPTVVTLGAGAAACFQLWWIGRQDFKYVQQCRSAGDGGHSIPCLV